jgi:hypothetical protein
LRRFLLFGLLYLYFLANDPAALGVIRSFSALSSGKLRDISDLLKNEIPVN